MQIIKLDLSDYEVPVNVVAKQGDVGRKFQAQIYDNGKEHLIPDGAMLSVWYSGTSGCGNYSMIGERSAFSVEGNAVTVELITQMLSNKGGGALCLVLNGADGTQIAMWNIAYIVEPIPGMGSPEAEAYFTAFSDNVAKALEAANRAESAALGFEIDATLTQRGKSADAKAAGDAIANAYLTAQYDEETATVALSYGGDGGGTGGGGIAFSPTVDVTEINGGHKVTVTDVNGNESFDVMDGVPGYTPVKGEDYYTEADKQEMVAAVLAAESKMELIDTITVEVENIGTIVRDGFMLDAVTFVVDCPATSATGKLQPVFHYPTESGGNQATMANLTVTNANNPYRTMVDFYRRFGWWRFEWISNVKTWTTSVTTQSQYTFAHNEDTFPYVNKIRLITTSLPIGTTISIYGVRRNEN